MTFPPDAATFAISRPMIQQWEKFAPRPYLCPAKKWTVGFGTTIYPNGKRVQPGDFPTGIPVSTALTYLLTSMERVRASLVPCLTRSPTVHQAAALIDLAYNIGVGVHDGIKGDLADSTLLSHFNAGDLAGAETHFMDWVYIHDEHGKAVKLDGLINRRAAEQAVFRTAG